MEDTMETTIDVLRDIIVQRELVNRYNGTVLILMEASTHLYLVMLMCPDQLGFR